MCTNGALFGITWINDEAEEVSLKTLEFMWCQLERSRVLTLSEPGGGFSSTIFTGPLVSLQCTGTAELDSYTNNHNSSCRKHTWMSNQMGQWEAEFRCLFSGIPKLQSRNANGEKCHLAWESLNSCLEPLRRAAASHQRLVNRSHFPNWTHKK